VDQIKKQSDLARRLDRWPFTERPKRMKFLIKLFAWTLVFAIPLAFTAGLIAAAILLWRAVL
jgi:hypothetical protein